MRKVGKLEGWKVEKITDVFELRPPKKEARDLLSENDLVSFLPMEDLEVFQRDIIATKEKPLKEVSGNYTYFANNDVLLAKITPCFENGKLGIARNLKNGIGFGSSEYIVFRSQGKVIPEYLFYYLARDEFRRNGEKAMTGAAGQKRIPPSFVGTQEIAYPPLPEQQRIVSVLDEAFASIAQVKSNAERNLVNARELFGSVLAKMYESAGKHWEEKNLGDIASEMQTGPFGSTLHKSDYVANGIPVINPQNLADGKIVPLQKMMVSQKTKERLSRYVLQEKDIVLARRGEMGRCAIVEKEQAGWLCGSGSFVIRIKKEVNANYLVRYLSSAKVKRILQKGSVGTTMDNLNQGILSQVPVPFPPLAEQRVIVGKLEALSAETKRLEVIYQRKLEALEELKKSVLRRAFEGEL
jgi:type I restriction enzyme S subunit